MTLSEIIQNEDYWCRRLETQRMSYRRASRADKPYHRSYCQRIIANIRQWRAAYRLWATAE
jgi:hypothetical protein